MDREISNEFQKILTNKGLNLKWAQKLSQLKIKVAQYLFHIQMLRASKKEKLEVDKVLVSVGRKPYTEGLNLSKVGIKKDNKGRIEVNE